MSDELQVSGGFDVFVSYNHADRDAARCLKELLQAFDKHVFLDRDSITSGARWDEQTRRDAQRTESLLIVCSKDTQHAACIKDELASLPPSTRIMPVRLDKAELPAGLSERTAFGASEVPERIIARTQALLAEGMTRGEAVECILQELSKDTVRPEQKRAVRAFVFGFNVESVTTLATNWLREWASRSLASPRVAGVALAAALLAGPVGYLVGQARGGDARASCESKLGALQGARAGYERSVNAELGSVRQRVSDLEAQVVSAQAALDSAKHGLGDQNTAIAKLTQQKTALEATQRALQKDLQERDRARAAREGELLQQLQELTEANQSLGARNETLASLNATLESRASALEAQNEKSNQALASAVRRLAANPPVLEPTQELRPGN